MNQKNTQKIYKDFPELFKHRDNPQESLMCFNFEYNDGWYDITYKLCKDINDWYIKVEGKIPEQFYVVQAKEKFGGLRFYITSAPEEIHDMIHQAEKHSFITCEECGKKGKWRADLPWKLTLCRKHYEEEKKNTS